MDRVESIKKLVMGTKIIDLSHTMCETMPAAPGHNQYFHLLWNSPEFGDLSTSYRLILNEHTGTHADAPSHFLSKVSPHCKTIDQIPIQSYLCPCKVIKILNKTGGEYITIEDLKDWENQNSPILESEGILISTGWDKLFESCSIDGLFIKSWPGLHENAVDYLLEKDISLIGIDTVSIDSSSSDSFPAHKKFLAHQIPVLENLNNLELIDLNCYLIALPLNINGGSASPVRAIALV